jgi:transcriptional regulator with XRE-family HTH domain
MEKYIRKGTKLQKSREEAGLTQEDLSEKTGISLSTIRSFEQRQRELTRARYNTVRDLARAIGCEIEDIID